MKQRIMGSVFLMLFVGVILLSCSGAKTGCPANESASVKIRKDGSLSTKRGKSQLFNKKMRKKMRH